MSLTVSVTVPSSCTLQSSSSCLLQPTQRSMPTRTPTSNKQNKKHLNGSLARHSELYYKALLQAVSRPHRPSPSGVHFKKLKTMPSQIADLFATQRLPFFVAIVMQGLRDKGWPASPTTRAVGVYSRRERERTLQSTVSSLKTVFGLWFITTMTGFKVKIKRFFYIYILSLSISIDARAKWVNPPCRTRTGAFFIYI